jgi:hypothetical protein
MAVFKPELHRLEDVLDYYENSPATHYKIFAGTSPKAEYCRFYFDEDEKEIGLQKLAEALRAIQQNVDNTNPYILQLIEKKKVARGKDSESLTQIVFQLNKAERYLPMMSGMQQQPNDNFNRLMEKMIEGQNLIISKLSADEFGEDMEEQKPKGFGAILENEQFQQLAIGALGLIINKFAAPNQSGLSTVTALAGIPDNEKEKALQAIEILSNKDAQYGTHLLYLANIDDSTYKMLLGFMK